MAGELGDRSRPSAALVELDNRRRAVTEALSDQRGKDLADLTDAEFLEGVRRVKLVQSRMQTLLQEVLVQEVHFGNPNNAFKKPILLKAGAEELRRLMRLTVRRAEPDEIVSSAEFVSVVVTLGIYDAVGRLLGTHRAACTTKEKRFKKFNGQGWTFDDAREVLHDCLAMAEKRAASGLTCEVSGATGFFANAEAMAAELDDDKVITPWTKEEKARVYETASKKKMSRNEIAALVLATLGRAQVGSGDDVDLLIAAIKTWERPKKASEASADSGPAPAAAASAPQLTPEQERQRDLELDKELSEAGK
jgi:hypothetical protein